MRRATCLTSGLTTAAFACVLGLAGAATAQEAAGAARGLRYLSWPGRAAAAVQTEVPAAEAPPADLRRPNRVIPHGGAAAVRRPGLAPAPAPVRRTLTPASAWLRPAPAPTPAPPPAPAPAPATQPPVPDYLPDHGGQPAPAAVAYPVPSTPQPSGPPSLHDPMAPRRDAPIFRLVPPTSAPVPAPEPSDDRSAGEAPPPRPVAAVTANSADRPQPQGARYYSVHRQNGREPDAVALPAPSYIDALAITMTEAPTTPDLAAPDPGPTLIRDAQGRVRAQPAAPEGDYR
ncbi:hypothetical protein [Brevundimonas viscosa]|uniref:Meckel syndrome type 1 protein n=1 Tax=Brevundimonas viscosa TaxID=871741 RepID=A0A1I6SIQ4_9CAUL|nr:hypothetical protein [Brevundimonas viscosa]SFS76851.1 Meckel syndrome type 1 protein [Brevundimonas viscosa]